MCIAQINNQTCTDAACCRNIANPNPTTGDGFLQFSGTCLSGGLNCVDETGCFLCHDPAVNNNVFNRPLCNAGALAPLPVCTDQACCNSVMSPNAQTGYGFLQFSQPCQSTDCVDGSNCIDCFNPAVTNQTNVLNRPVCSAAAIASFGNLANPTVLTTIAPTTVATTQVIPTTVPTTQVIPTSVVSSSTVIQSTTATTQAIPTTVLTTQATPTTVTTQAIPTTVLTTQAVPTTVLTTQAVPTTVLTTQAIPTTAVTTQAVPTTVVVPSTVSVFTGLFSTFNTITQQQGAASSLIPTGLLLLVSMLAVFW